MKLEIEFNSTIYKEKQIRLVTIKELKNILERQTITNLKIKEIKEE